MAWWSHLVTEPFVHEELHTPQQLLLILVGHCSADFYLWLNRLVHLMPRQTSQANEWFAGEDLMHTPKSPVKILHCCVNRNHSIQARWLDHLPSSSYQQSHVVMESAASLEQTFRAVYLWYLMRRCDFAEYAQTSIHMALYTPHRF